MSAAQGVFFYRFYFNLALGRLFTMPENRLFFHAAPRNFELESGMISCLNKRGLLTCRTMPNSALQSF